MSQKLWGGRFKKSINPKFEMFSSSFKWDWRLLPYDLKIDAAHVKALKKCGVLSVRETTKFLSAITSLEKEYQKGILHLDSAAEDIHSAIQTKLFERLGSLADKLHTARSRNDLVAQSSRLYCKDHAARLIRLVRQLQKTLVSKADENQTVWVPGMTHLQNAQVLSQAHIFLGYAEMLERSNDSLTLALRFSDVCVLGSGALTGVTFSLDQRFLARLLGLTQITRNSYDVSGDRDFVRQFLSACSHVGTQLSRMAEDLMIGQLKSTALVDIDEVFCTGSSMMPQKKNADFLELARGAAGVLIGNVVGFALTLKGLPTSYNRDLQWDKKYLFESAETVGELLEIFIKLFGSLQINKKRAEALVKDETLYATDLADHLVRKGVPFKIAHEQVGRIVSFAEAQRVPISKIGLDLLRRFAPKLDGSVYDLFDADHSVKLKRTIGSTSPKQVEKQIKYWERRLVNTGFVGSCRPAAP